MKPPIVVFNVIVIEAEGLEAKDINGYSDPYCMLGIQPGEIKCKPVPLDDGGVYCGDEPDENGANVEEITNVTIVSGWNGTESSISSNVARR